MKKIIYLDNGATTRVLPKVADTMAPKSKADDQDKISIYYRTNNITIPVKIVQNMRTGTARV